jgi:hypothetical protein
MDKGRAYERRVMIETKRELWGIEKIDEKDKLRQLITLLHITPRI